VQPVAVDFLVAEEVARLVALHGELDIRDSDTIAAQDLAEVERDVLA
jgi:hypothetical protein